MSCLDVYFYGVHAGQLARLPSAALRFSYVAAYLAAKGPAISAVLPLREAPYEGVSVLAYFSGLLPEAWIRQKVARFVGVSEKNAFALLEAIGGECAGALAFYPEGKKPDDFFAQSTTLDEQGVVDLLSLLRKRPLLAGSDDVRLSLAGAQDKVAVSLSEKGQIIVGGSEPTTHIIKPAVEGLKDSVENECFCMQLAQNVGIETPDTWVRYAGGEPYFLIERYDRKKTKEGVVRTHQEDFCQILGVMPEHKYEREGGVSVLDALNIIKQYSIQPVVDQQAFIRRLIFNVLVGNADAHGKNFAMLYEKGAPRLAPAYDILSTAIYPELSKKMAMKIGKEYDANKLFLRHWLRLVPETKHAQKLMQAELKQAADEVLQQLVLTQKQFEVGGVQADCFEQIMALVEKRANKILKE